MKQNLADQLSELEALAHKLSLKILYEKIRSIHPRKGGLCRIKGEWRLYIEKKTSLSEKVVILIEAISRFPIDDIYISPKMRQVLDLKRTENKERGRTIPATEPEKSK